MKRLAALILAAAVLSGCRAGEKRNFDLRKTILCGGDAKELRISDVPGESKVIAYLPQSGAEADYKRLYAIYRDAASFVPVYPEARDGGYTCRDGSLAGNETKLFLTDAEGGVRSSFGSSFGGAAKELAGMCGTDTLRERVIPLICWEYGIPDGEVLLIAYKPTCRLCREELDEIYSRREELKKRYYVVVLTTSEDTGRGDLGDVSFIDVSEIYLKSLKPENNIGMYLIKDGEYAGEYK